MQFALLPAQRNVLCLMTQVMRRCDLAARASTHLYEAGLRFMPVRSP